MLSSPLESMSSYLNTNVNTMHFRSPLTHMYTPVLQLSKTLLIMYLLQAPLCSIVIARIKGL